MPDSLAGFDITRRWPARHPDRIQLYTLGTPNGVKPVIMLEEAGLPYELQRVDFGRQDQKTPEFLSLNPNGKIPAMIDPQGSDGRPLALWESGAILLYLADKTGRFLPQDPQGRWHGVQWLMFQMGGIGPMFGQVGFFNKFDGSKWEDKRPLQRYVAEARRLLGVMDGALAGRQWFLGDAYSIADISMLGWVKNLITFYQAGDLVAFDEYRNVAAWLERGLERPAVKRAYAAL